MLPLLLLLLAHTLLFDTCSPLPADTSAHADAVRADEPWPEDRFEAAVLEGQLRFLASDELGGRRTGTIGNDVAARYLAEQLRAFGVAPAPGTDGTFFQEIPFVRTAPAESGFFALGGDTLRQGERLLVMAGGGLAATAPAVFAGHGLAEADYAGKDVQGKVVVTQLGRPGDSNLLAALQATAEKQRLAAAHGAVGVVELFGGGMPWRSITGYLGRPRFGLEPEGGAPRLPLAWAEDTGGTLAAALADGAEAVTFVSSGFEVRPARSRNVAGVIEGADPALRDEYVVLMAHYDHVGTDPHGRSATPQDSIFNGARDNGMGTVAVLNAARALAEVRPARSVLVLLVTAEEEGLLGSNYYVEHPLVPLRQIVFAINTDGAGYSDTGIVTAIGSERTTAAALFAEAAGRYGLDAHVDPNLTESLFQRSDHYHFARHGVPAPTLSPGFRSLQDDEVARYYHRVEDEVDEAFQVDYLLRFAQTFAHTARLVADAEERPTWVPGDPLEQAAQTLYGE